MSKTVVYSCVTGGYDKLSSTILASAPQVGEDISFVLFTDDVELADKYLSAGNHINWDIRPLVWKHPLCKRRSARWHKLNSHLLFDNSVKYTVWFDGSQRIKPASLFPKLVEPVLLKHDIATFKHPDRTCVYQELQACRKLRKDNPTLMSVQLQRYRAEGYPPFNGLVETACVVRRQSADVARFNKAWWEELRLNSFRDQLSFNYVSWKLSVPYAQVPGCRVRSPYCDFIPHGQG